MPNKRKTTETGPQELPNFIKQEELQVICQVVCLVECQEGCLVMLEMLKEVLGQPLKKLINFVIHMKCSICLYYHKEIVSWNVWIIHLRNRRILHCNYGNC